MELEMLIIAITIISSTIILILSLVIAHIVRERNEKKEKIEEMRQSDLTRRQQEIYDLITANANEGKVLSNKELASSLNISEGTVKNHKHTIFQVMECGNQTELILKFNRKPSEEIIQES